MSTIKKTQVTESSENNVLEVWNDIVGYEGLYQVSNLGRVKSLEKKVRGNNSFVIRKAKILKKTITKDKNYVGLWRNKKSRTYSVDGLVSKSFIENPNNNKFIIHKDNDPLNDSAYNLEWSNINDVNTKYSIEIRKLAIKEYLDGKTITELEKKYKAADTVID